MLGRQLNEDESGVIPINSMYEKGHDEIHAATTSDGVTLQTQDPGKASQKKSPVASKQKTIVKAPSKETVKKQATKKLDDKDKGTAGTLFLTVKNADLTRDTDIIGKQDPFVKLDLYN